MRPLLASERQAQKPPSHLRFPADNNRGLVLSRAEEVNLLSPPPTHKGGGIETYPHRECRWKGGRGGVWGEPRGRNE